MSTEIGFRNRPKLWRIPIATMITAELSQEPEGVRLTTEQALVLEHRGVDLVGPGRRAHVLESQALHRRAARFGFNLDRRNIDGEETARKSAGPGLCKVYRGVISIDERYCRVIGMQGVKA